MTVEHYCRATIRRILVYRPKLKRQSNPSIKERECKTVYCTVMSTACLQKYVQQRDLKKRHIFPAPLLSSISKPRERQHSDWRYHDTKDKTNLRVFLIEASEHFQVTVCDVFAESMHLLARTKKSAVGVYSTSWLNFVDIFSHNTRFVCDLGSTFLARWKCFPGYIYI